MSAARISTIPVEARPYQGAAAGFVTRVVANTVDALVVGVTVAGIYAGYVGIRLILQPRTFQPVEPTWWWVMDAFLIGLVAYLTAGWWISGRTYGGRVMGIRVIRADGARIGFVRSFARALTCVVFPVGLLWCVAGPGHRSVQDLVLRTRVVHDWRSRSADVGAAS
jgi:uncharacterized RDD family membrane protein YckC